MMRRSLHKKGIDYLSISLFFARFPVKSAILCQALRILVRIVLSTTLISREAVHKVWKIFIHYLTSGIDNTYSLASAIREYVHLYSVDKRIRYLYRRLPFLKSFVCLYNHLGSLDFFPLLDRYALRASWVLLPFANRCCYF